MIAMQFSSANPSVVRSIKQRVLLNAWLRAQRKPQVLPALADFQPDGIADELPDMMRFSVENNGETARFPILQEGSRLAATYGSDHIDPVKRTNRYLDDAIGADRYARVLPCYLECLARRRPTYSISHVHDGDGKEVSFERLLLPFGATRGVELIVGSYKAISIEGRFRLNSLMGLDACSAPVRVVNAVIDSELAARPLSYHAAGDVIEVE
jgi:hypothetical protein